MRWGRRWGRWPEMKGFPNRFSRWGGEWDDAAPPGTRTLEVIFTGHRFTPCDSCRRKVNCALFKNYVKIWRHQEYNQGTRVLGNCNIYVPQHMPGSIHREVPRDRTSGKEPT